MLGRSRSMSPGAQFGRSTPPPPRSEPSPSHPEPMCQRCTSRRWQNADLVRFLRFADRRKHHRPKNMLLPTLFASISAFALVGGLLLVLDPGVPKHEAVKTGGLAGGAIV